MLSRIHFKVTQTGVPIMKTAQLLAMMMTMLAAKEEAVAA
jgi:hypothetical protein